MDEISWENFNESTYLIGQVEKYFEYTGYYPESIHVDQIYRTKDNRKDCKEKGIRMSIPPLGRRKKNVSKEETKKPEKMKKLEIESKENLEKGKENMD